MYLMYVDESGDSGMENSPTRYFILSGLVLHELAWQQTLEVLVDFRRGLKATYGLRLREEIHAAHFISRPGRDIKRNDRLAILRHFAKKLAQTSDISFINVVVDKSTKGDTADIFSLAWEALIQRFQNTISYRNFPGPKNSDDKGMILPDQTDVMKLTKLLRRMRRFNPVPNQQGMGAGYRDLPLTKIVEDPFFKDSGATYFIQACDLVAHLLKQHLDPSSYFRKKSAHNYFGLLRPVLCTKASAANPDGVVRL